MIRQKASRISGSDSAARVDRMFRHERLPETVPAAFDEQDRGDDARVDTVGLFGAVQADAVFPHVGAGLLDGLGCRELVVVELGLAVHEKPRDPVGLQEDLGPAVELRDRFRAEAVGDQALLHHGEIVGLLLRGGVA